MICDFCGNFALFVIIAYSKSQKVLKNSFLFFEKLRSKPRKTTVFPIFYKRNSSYEKVINISMC